MSEEHIIMEEQKEYTPSPKWKRVMAWVLFGIMCVGIVCWLLNIAYPNWIESAKQWLSNTF